MLGLVSCEYVTHATAVRYVYTWNGLLLAHANALAFRWGGEFIPRGLTCDMVPQHAFVASVLVCGYMLTLSFVYTPSNRSALYMWMMQPSVDQAISWATKVVATKVVAAAGESRSATHYEPRSRQSTT